MKKLFLLGLPLLPVAARASGTTIFFADFEGAGKNTRITAANRLTTIQPGTAVGSWEIITDRPGTQVKDTAASAALQMRTGHAGIAGNIRRPGVGSRRFGFLG